MKVKFGKLFIHLAVWTLSEVTLNLVGLDTLADYSEFLLNQQQIVDLTPPISITA